MRAIPAISRPSRDEEPFGERLSSQAFTASSAMSSRQIVIMGLFSVLKMFVSSATRSVRRPIAIARPQVFSSSAAQAFSVDVNRSVSVARSSESKSLKW